MTHISTRLPQEVENGAVRRDVEDVEIVRTDSGAEVRNVRASQSLLEYDCSYPASERDAANYLAVRAAYKAARGPLHSFDFWDWADYQATAEPIGTGDGSTTVFNLVKTYTFGSQAHIRRIYRPVAGITILKDGVIQLSGYSVNYDTGVVTFAPAPAAAAVITWTGEFNVPVRFDGPLTSTGLMIHLEHIDTIHLVEVRL